MYIMLSEKFLLSENTMILHMQQIAYVNLLGCVPAHACVIKHVSGNSLLHHSKLFCSISTLKEFRRKSLTRIRQIPQSELCKLIMLSIMIMIVLLIMIMHVSRWGVRSTLILGGHKPVHLYTNTYQTNNNYGHMYRLQV